MGIQENGIDSCAVVIPTDGKNGDIRETLRSLVKAAKPPGWLGVWLVENGGTSNAEVIAKEFQARLPLTYVMEDRMGVSFGRNRGIREACADLLIFVDDDVTVSPQLLSTYWQKAVLTKGQAFLGGPVEPDYEVPPDSWLRERLPPSAAGLNLGNQELEIEKPIFIGPNMAVPQRVLRRVGDFDSLGAIGRGGPLGEERRLQARMLEAGFKGIYCPDALVYHRVPRERCTESWALGRVERDGFTKGLIRCGALTRDLQPNARLYVFRMYCAAYMQWLLRLLAGSRLERRYDARREIAYWRGQRRANREAAGTGKPRERAPGK